MTRICHKILGTLDAFYANVSFLNLTHANTLTIIVKIKVWFARSALNLIKRKKGADTAIAIWFLEYQLRAQYTS